MHILLTDLAICPRCGPEFGLILLADSMDDRDVVEGRLGCANCREEYPINGGVADVRLGETDAPPADAPGDAGEQAMRIAALLGGRGAGGWVVLAGVTGEVARQVGVLLPETGIVVVARQPTADPGSNLVLSDRGLPLRGATVRGVAMAGGADAGLLAEAARVVAPGGRIVVDGAGADTRRLAEQAGLDVLLHQEDTLVVARPGVARGTLQR